MIIKYAMLDTSGWVNKYEGEPIEGLVAGDVNNRVTETQALNLLGAKGYEVYDMERGMNGQLPRIVFRLKRHVPP